MLVRISAYTLLSFNELVNQCWGLLKLTLRVTFPTTTRAHPSQYVLIEPGGYMWPGDFWQDVPVPTLTALLAITPVYQDGWSNPMARNLVEGYLRRSLAASSWQTRMDFNH